jgi:hypothetical protein
VKLSWGSGVDCVGGEVDLRPVRVSQLHTSLAGACIFKLFDFGAHIVMLAV